MEQLYKTKPYMIEGMYCVGTKPKSLGEGVVVVAHSVDYETAWNYWDEHYEQDLAIFQWRLGVMNWVGKKYRNPQTGLTYYVPIPPRHLASA